MAIDTATLKTALKNVFDNLDKDKTTQDAADAIADALDAWIKSASVTTSVNTVVVGTCPAGAVSGTGTGTGTGSIS